ncbi:helix-turn-helix transcriptional regulator [Echinicola sp. 20G]|uniref:ArsR/SmtB family transcription factor n=1 Tax=Echinicola sp. 20G TaxID=2781961 RepID=UPI00190FD4ED|nr:metalloregulator ArsR/SmtB family transcription factor [Echinicola sp. 20G]
MLDAFQVIADPNRRKILFLLSKENLSINSLVKNFDISRPAISKHIKILQLGGFVEIQNIGRERVCMIKQDGFDELKSWIAYYDHFWANKLTQLGNLMDEDQRE